MSNKYMPYDVSDIDTLMNEPWEISDKPFMLHAAYALSCLYDIMAPEDDEEFVPDDMWGNKIDKKILDRLVQDISDDFNDAATNRKQVRIWGKNYSIRKVNAYDHNRLGLIFNFPFENGEYILTKEGVLNLRGPVDTELLPFETTREQAKSNRTYLRQIIMLAEDDDNNGWDHLTDMEIVIYCWALFYNKCQNNNFKQFKNEYKDYLYVADMEIFNCMNEKSTLRQCPVGMYAFSHDKTLAWNKAHRQESTADKIPASKAEDYWYDIALKKTFKPIDQR